jgi:hypothetical protein
VRQRDFQRAQRCGRCRHVCYRPRPARSLSSRYQ